MRLRDDERGQSVQVGAVLLFGILVISFSTYQAFVVPDQNREVEFDHNQQVQDEMLDLRNAVVSMPGGGSPTSTSVTLGTTYPSRAVALNPDPPSGRLRTVGTTDPRVNLTIENAAVDGETGDVWDGTERTYDSGGVVYQPGYNVYDGAPATVYENTLLYNSFDADTLVVANQTFLDGDELSLVTVDGSLDRSSTAATGVDVRPVSSSTETIEVSAADADSPVTVTFASRLSASEWERILSDQDAVEDVTEPTASVPDPFTVVRVELDPAESYRLQLTKVGVGTDVSDEDAAYITDVEGDGTAVARGESREVTIAVRDNYNNPVSGVGVVGNVTGSNNGWLESPHVRTDEDGRATFRYRTHESNETGDHRINFTMDEGATLSKRPFDASTATNASVHVTMESSRAGGGSGPFTVDWNAPAANNAGGPLSASCSDPETTCQWDAGADSDSRLNLSAVLDVAQTGVSVDFSVDDASVGEPVPGRNDTTAGRTSTTLVPVDNGTVTVTALVGGESDELSIEVYDLAPGQGGSGETIAYPDEFDDIDYDSTETDENNSIPPPGDGDGALTDFGNIQSSDDGDATATIEEGGGTLDRGVGLATYDIDQTGSEYEFEVRYTGLENGERSPEVAFVDDSGQTLQTTSLDPSGDGFVTETVTLNSQATQSVHDTGNLFVVYRRADDSGFHLNFDVDYQRIEVLD